MSLSAQNIVGNHRAVYFEAVGDGVTTTITVPLAHLHARASVTGTATVRTGPTGTASHESGKGGLYLAPGTNVAVASATVANGTLTVTMQAAVSNGVRVFGVFVLDASSARN